MFNYINKIFHVLLMLTVVALFSSCSSLGSRDRGMHINQFAENAHYLQTYAINANAGASTPRYQSGSFLYNDLIIACHIYVPKKPIGTVFLLHGYLDHSAAMRYAINSALARGYAVFSYDLPGHGLSSGTMGDIYGVENNAALLNALFTSYRQELPAPHHLVGFSTGGAIAIEYSRHTNFAAFQKTALVSPLIRHTQWHWARLAYSLFSPFKKRLKRVDKNNSSNKEYLRFAKNDPLRISHLSVSFLGDVYRWHDKLVRSEPWDQSFLIIQGDSDKIVDWEYNVNYLENYTKVSSLIMIERAKHQLFNEKPAIRKAVFKHIFEYLEE